VIRETKNVEKWKDDLDLPYFISCTLRKKKRIIQARNAQSIQELDVIIRFVHMLQVL